MLSKSLAFWIGQDTIQVKHVVPIDFWYWVEWSVGKVGVDFIGWLIGCVIPLDLIAFACLEFSIDFDIAISQLVHIFI